jgi:2-dehydropantoate 2-reductase
MSEVGMPHSPKFCVYGAGAVGGTIGGMLAQEGATVSMIARGETLTALKRNGLTLINAGERLQIPVHASADPAELGPQDYVIVAVKAPALPDVAARIAPLLGPETVVVTAMNGVPWWFFANDNGPLAGRQLTAVDPDGAVGRAIPANRVIGCVVLLSSSLEAPGVVRHNAHRQLVIGEANGESTSRLARLAYWLRRAGFKCMESSNIRRDIWLKLYGNLTTNPISMLTAATLDRIVGDPLVRELCLRMMAEVGRIGWAIGIPRGNSVEEIMKRARSFGPIKTSMLQDAERGTPVEIDALLTVAHDIGGMVNVPTPFIDSVLGLARLRASSLGLLAKRDLEQPVPANDQYAVSRSR